MVFAFVTAIPFLLALLLVIPPFKSLSKFGQTVITAAALAGMFVAFLSLVPRLQSETVIIVAQQWLPSFGIGFSFYVDGLAMIFALIITGVGALIFLYAGYYFDDAAQHNRFIAWLLAFAGAMLLLVLSGNLLLTFIAWELTSATSFMLIGFTGKHKQEARQGAFKALFVTSAGALSLIIGLVILGVACGQALYPEAGGRFVTDISDILRAQDLHQHEWFPIFTVLILLGGLSKSAQFPFHFWLPGAMSAPTPASAYLHSATMVKAGIFLFARLSPVMYKNPLWSDLLLFFGLTTMLLGAIFALKQADIKGLLAYSTVSKLGLIVALIGLPGQNGIKAALLGIIAHALYKSALFLVAGTIDHATGTRLFERLGGLRTQLPVMFVVTVISAFSMAGVPFFLGFVAKETLLEAMLHYSAPQTALIMSMVIASAVFTACAAYMLIYDLFWKPAPGAIHFHQPPSPIRLGPVVLSLGSLTLGVLVEPVIKPLLELAVPKAFELHVFAGFNDVFWLSLAILTAGFAVFIFRRPLIKRIGFPLSGDRVYAETLAYIEWAGSNALSLQTGQVRDYLAIILAVVALVLVVSDRFNMVTAGLTLFPFDLAVTITDLSKIFLLFLAVAAGVLTVFLREHVKAAIAFGVIGYAIGVIFLIEHAPDVALVQLLVETMATVLIIIMLGRIKRSTRQKVINNMWGEQESKKSIIFRDVLIAFVIGSMVFVFALIALQNKEDRNSIADWHLENTAPLLNTEDVVGAIVASFRGTDTLLEIVVFTTAALGVLTLLAHGLQARKSQPPRKVIDMSEPGLEAAQDSKDRVVQDATELSTPFTRSVSTIVLPIAILIGIAQILYGGGGPGDGFTAGVTIGLAVSLWFIVLGYQEAKARLSWFRPTLIVRIGLLVALINASIPLLFGKGFMGHVEFDKTLGIYDFVGSFGLHVNSSLIFEIAIALTVMGGLGIIIESIAQPQAVALLEEE